MIPRTPPPPRRLREVQHWFAGIITQRLNPDSTINPIAPSGMPIAEEATHYIAPSPTLSSGGRIEIYNQQYWWRLISNLQESFPTLVCLFGYHDFNEKIAIPYLERYTPNHWSLIELGGRLLYWISRHYDGVDKPLIYATAALDQAYQDGFVAASNTPLTLQDIAEGESFFQQTLYLQPHIDLFSFRYHFPQFRDLLLEEKPEHWIDHDFPPLQREKSLAFMVWRDIHNNVGWILLDCVEYKLLKKIQRGISMNGLCEWLESQNPVTYEKAAENLQLWTSRWTVNEWLTKVQT